MPLPDMPNLRNHLAQTRSIIRRYAVVNGFDGALTMLGLLTGFRLGGQVPLDTVIAACVGAAVALGVSGLTSAYLSESAERRRALAELEAAMVTDLQGSTHARAAQVLPCGSPDMAWRCRWRRCRRRLRQRSCVSLV